MDSAQTTKEFLAMKEFLVRLTTAQDRELDDISEKLGQSKAALVREAVTVLIGNYKRMLEDAEKVD